MLIRFRVFLITCILVIITLSFFSIIFPISHKGYAQSAVLWHDAQRRYRIKLTIAPNSSVASGKAIEVSLNFIQLLSQAGQSGTVNLNSLRLIEVNSQGGITNGSVPFQFDNSSESSGKLIFLVSDIAASNTKNYYLYFDVGSSFTKPSFTPQVSLMDNVNYQGQSSYKLTTTSGTYYYHKDGAGFAGMMDKDNVDWISYRPTGGSAGDFRGIPNMVHPEGFFHPGSTGSTSQIVSQGPLKITIRSTNGNWVGMWEVYPFFARMTLSSTAHAYWFLYEGTPNGGFNPNTNFMILSSGERFTGGQTWTKDLPSPEWIYFSDTLKNRALFLSHLEDDSQIDSYKPMQNNMTIFGFGRDGTAKHLTTTPARFLIGFIETNVHTNASVIINSYSQNVSSMVSPVEIRSGVTITQGATPTVTSGLTPSATPPTGGQTRFGLTVFLHGIGRGGDNTAPNSTGNINPLHTLRAVTIEAYDINNQLSVTKQGNITFNSSNGNFNGTINMDPIVPGVYTIRVKSPQFLKKGIPGIITVTTGQTVSLANIYLVTGDTNNDNSLSVLDYNLLLDCYSDINPPRDCSDPNKKTMSDITDDGKTNQFDYNLFLRELSSQQGQ